jgi:hypothetical protein
MSWISDVVPYSTILSTWGNNIRNRIVQTFDSVAEMNSHAASLPDGSLATVPGDHTLYAKRGTFKPQTPLLVTGTVYSGVSGADTGGVGYKASDLVVPAGYRVAYVSTSVRVSFSGNTTAGANAGMNGLTAGMAIGYFNRHYPTAPFNGFLDVLNLDWVTGVDVNGGQVIQVNVSCQTAGGNMGWANDQSNTLQAIFFP